MVEFQQHWDSPGYSDWVIKRQGSGAVKHDQSAGFVLMMKKGYMQRLLWCFLLLAVTASAKSGYEQHLLEVIAQIKGLNHDQALDRTRHLIQQYPDSRLGQMLYADLLMTKVGPLTHIGLGLPQGAAVQDFRHEIQQRWQSLSSPAHRGMYPANILHLSESQPYLILVDQQYSRIYVYRNQRGIPVLAADYFISIGLKGMDKQRRGDQKTPTGIYHINRYIDGLELPDLYGEGAFPISYPNSWDRRKKRTGDGIWIHGTPSGTYNRSPWATNGCVVLSNADFLDISQYLNQEIYPPVIVSDQIEWLTAQQWQKQRQDWLQLIQRWIDDWESLDHNRYRQHYSPSDYFADGRDFKSWDAHKRWVNRNKTNIAIRFRHLNVFTYPGEEGLVLVQFQQDYSSSNFNLRSSKELYWRKFDLGWKIVYEGERPQPIAETAQNRALEYSK